MVQFHDDSASIGGDAALVLRVPGEIDLWRPKGTVGSDVAVSKVEISGGRAPGKGLRRPLQEKAIRVSMVFGHGVGLISLGIVLGAAGAIALCRKAWISAVNRSPSPFLAARARLP